MIRHLPRINAAFLLFAFVWLLLGRSSADDDSANAVRLPIQHSRDEGKSLWYEPVALKHGVVRFHETPESLNQMSRLIDYTLHLDGEKLRKCSLVLRPEPQKWRAAPPNSQHDQLPDSAYTMYEDLNGDSVFDTMVKVGPGAMSSYILLENHWVEVNNSMVKREGRVARSLADGREYILGENGWKPR